MNRSVWAIAALLCVVVASAAKADWQYTKWGMSLDEVIAASKGQMERCDGACAKLSTDAEFAGATGPYQSGPFDFKAVAYFDKKTGKLSSMLLYLKDVDQAFRLQDELKAKYGRPASNMDVSVTRTTVWLTDTEKVEFSLIYKALVSVKYQPRLTASNKGL